MDRRSNRAELRERELSCSNLVLVVEPPDGDMGLKTECIMNQTQCYLAPGAAR